MQGTILTAPLGTHIVSKTSLTLARLRVARLSQTCGSLPPSPCWCTPLVPPHRKETVQGKPCHHSDRCNSSWWHEHEGTHRADLDNLADDLVGKELDLQPSSSAALWRSESFTKFPPHLSCYAFWEHILHVYRNTFYLVTSLCKLCRWHPVRYDSCSTCATDTGWDKNPQNVSQGLLWTQSWASFLAVLTACSRISSRS